MQNSHSRTDLALPQEWSLSWWRSDSYRILTRTDPPGPIGPDDPAWTWCEGVLWAGDVGVKYDPVPEAAIIFDEALRVVPDDAESVLTFVRRWGLPTGEYPDYSLWSIRRVFRELQRHFAWARALQAHEWRSPAIPSLWDDQDAFLDALRMVVPPPEHSNLEAPRHDPRWPDLVRNVVLQDVGGFGDPNPYDPFVSAFIKGHFYVTSHARREHVRPRDREQAHWRAFGWAIRNHLRLVNPAVGWDAGRPNASWFMPRLVDLLWVQLWNLVTGGATMRQCRHCRRWFPLDRRGKVYCSRVCTNRASAKSSYEARKSRARRKRR